VATWKQVEAEAPALAARAREIFDAFKHKTIATLRRDGSPRISGTEVEFVDGGDVVREHVEGRQGARSAA
jgi:hypothetical protein